MNTIKNFINDNNSQSHLCICNTSLLEDTIFNGIYGFPHAGGLWTKSFWRSVSSMYNIGVNDLIFLYRTNGQVEGCKEIHGPFKVFSDLVPAIFYQPHSQQFPMYVNETADCKVRFLFQKMTKNIYSIANNYELIKSYENKSIWGYRHPAVMNIGAARKKSVTSFTKLQTLEIIRLMEEFGEKRYELNSTIPREGVKNYHRNIEKEDGFYLNENFLLNNFSNDEAYLYAYILFGIKNPNSNIGKILYEDFNKINDFSSLDKTFSEFHEISRNALLEAIISPHLQDELDLVLFNSTDEHMIIMEIKSGLIDETAINQTLNYLDLLSSIFPEKKIKANVIGSNLGAINNYTHMDKIKFIQYQKDDRGSESFFLRFYPII